MAPEGRSCGVYDPTSVNRALYGNVEVNVRRFSKFLRSDFARLAAPGGLTLEVTTRRRSATSQLHTEVVVRLTAEGHQS